MPEDTYYPEPDDQQMAVAASPDNDEQNEDYSTGLLPKQLFGEDIKPGDTVTVTVKRVLDNEVEVALPETETKEEQPSDADLEIDRMAGVVEE